MPYKSEAQRRKLHQLAKEGKISKATVDEFDKASEGKDLPERVEPKQKSGRIQHVKKVKVLK